MPGLGGASEVERTTLVPPMSERIKFDRQGFPYWLVVILLIIAWMGYLILTNDQYGTAYERIVPGLATTIRATVTGFVLALAIGMLAGLGRIAKNTLIRNIAVTYIEFVRGVPILVLIAMTAFVIVPQLSDAFGFDNASVDFLS